MKRLRIRISGDVQGVFFRHYAQESALKLDLTGWIRNDPDGTVFLVAEGDDPKVDEFLEWVKQGPPMATIDSVDAAVEDYAGENEGFEIR